MAIALSGTSLLAYYDPQQDALANGQANTVSNDYSGNARGLTANNTAPAVAPSYVTPAVNGRAAVRWSGTNTPLTSAANITVSCGFIVAKINSATFSNFGGLLTDTGTNGVLIGNSGTANFFDFSANAALAFSRYSLDNTGYAQSGMLAPMNAYRIIFFQYTNPVALTGIKIGQDRNDTTRGLNGDLALMALYGAGHIYGDAANRLAAHDTLASMFGVALPATNALEQGYTRERYYAFAPEYPVQKTEYQDSGVSFNELSSAPILKWEIGYYFDTRISGDLAVMNQFDSHYKDVRTSRTFSFTDKKGVTHTGVRYQEYTPEHEAHKSWNQRRRMILIKYP